MRQSTLRDFRGPTQHRRVVAATTCGGDVVFIEGGPIWRRMVLGRLQHPQFRDDARFDISAVWCNVASCARSAAICRSVYSQPRQAYEVFRSGPRSSGCHPSSGDGTQCCDIAIERLATRCVRASFRCVVRWNRAIHGGAVESRSGSPRRRRSSTARHAVSIQVDWHLVVQRESWDGLGRCLWMQRGR